MLDMSEYSRTYEYRTVFSQYSLRTVVYHMLQLLLLLNYRVFCIPFLFTTANIMLHCFQAVCPRKCMRVNL